MTAQEIMATQIYRNHYQPSWMSAPKQRDALIEITQSARSRLTSLLEVGPWHGDYSCEFLKQGWQLTVVEPWLGQEAYFNVRQDLDRSQLELDRRPVEQMLRHSSTRRWDVIFSPGLLYHVHDPFGIIDSYITATDHIFLDTLHWIKGVKLNLRGHDASYRIYWDRKPFRLTPGPWLVDHYFRSQGWCRGWHGMLLKVSGWPIWTAYYHAPNTEPLASPNLTDNAILDLSESRPIRHNDLNQYA